MASARVLTTNELGTIRYQNAAIHNQWPIEVRLLPQSNDTVRTIYTLHTPGMSAAPFTPTEREELRATLAVSTGALVYEVLRDGLLVSTGGLEVRHPQPVPNLNPPTSPISTLPSHSTCTSAVSNSTTSTSTSTSSSYYDNRFVGATKIEDDNKVAPQLKMASGACQVLLEQGATPDAHDRWPVKFYYHEHAWTIREVSIIEENTGNIVAVLSMSDEHDGFEGDAWIPVGVFTYRFRVVPDTQVNSDPTRLGWDDGAMTTAWELMTWPLFITVTDISIPGNIPGNGLMTLEPYPKFSTDISRIDEDDLDDEDDEDEDIIGGIEEEDADYDGDEENDGDDGTGDGMSIQQSRKDTDGNDDDAHESGIRQLTNDFQFIADSSRNMPPTETLDVRQTHPATTNSNKTSMDWSRLDLQQRKERHEQAIENDIEIGEQGNNNRNQSRGGGWSGIALNAAMFILGSTVTLLIGMGSRRRNQNGDSGMDSDDEFVPDDDDAASNRIDEMSDGSEIKEKGFPNPWTKTLGIFKRFRGRDDADSDNENEADVYVPYQSSSKNSSGRLSGCISKPSRRG